MGALEAYMRKFFSLSKIAHSHGFFYMGIFGIVLIIFALFFHLLLNNYTVQTFILKTVNKKTGIALHWEGMTFNGATGHFTGRDLSLDLPKAGAQISLKSFNLALNPFALLIGRIHLLDLNAQTLNVEITGAVETPQVVRDPSKSIARLFELFNVDKASLTHIQISLPTETHLNIEKLQLTKSKPLLLYKKALEILADSAQITSPYLDAFIKKTQVSGSLNVVYNEKIRKNDYYFNGKVALEEALFGFNKTPSPWNPSPSWDESLTPLISPFYPEGIPENRSFFFIDKLSLPVVYEPQLLNFSQGSIDAFNGKIHLQGEWNRKSEKVSFLIDTPEKLHAPLLPLGKAKVRSLFENLSLNWQGAGSVKDLEHGEVQTKLKIDLSGNLIVPEKNEATLTASPSFKDGIIRIPDLKGQFAEGTIAVEGTVNLPQRELKASVSCKALDAQTIVRAFTTVNIPGTADCSGRLGGTFDNPDFELSIDSPNAGYENLLLGSARANLKIKNQELLLEAQNTQEKGSGHFSLVSHHLFQSGPQNMELKFSLADMDAGAMLHAPLISGQVVGSFTLNKTGIDYTGKGEAEIKEIKIGAIPIDSIKGNLEVKNKSMTIRPLRIVWNPTSPAVQIPQSLTFNFSPEGYTFSGALLPTVTAEGQSLVKEPGHLLLKVHAKNTPLDFLAPLIPVSATQFITSGDLDIDYKTKEPRQSVIKANISAFNFEGEGKHIHLLHNTLIEYQNALLNFHQAEWSIGRGQLQLNGQVGLESASNLAIKGSLDLSDLNDLQPWIAEASGMSKIDLIWTGTLQEPLFRGSIAFDQASLLFSELGRELTDTTGKIEITDNRFDFQNMHALLEDSPARLNGWVVWKPASGISSADLTLNAQELPLSTPDTWHILVDTDLRLSGTTPALRLSGTLNIIEGLYYKDYTISQFVLKPVGVVENEESVLNSDFVKKLQLDLKLKSTGDFIIKNNLADLTLNTDMGLSGTVEHPVASGTINVAEGKIHSFGIDFENATGFATFSQDHGLVPLIEFQASQIIQDYEIRATIRGYADNLSLGFESIPSLNQSDIVALIAFGRTPDQLTTANRNLFTRAAIASQILDTLQGPLSRATHLDILRLESANFDQLTAGIARLDIGKKLSDRVSFVFTTDLALDESFRGIGLEYLLFDNLLLKSSKDTGSRYRFDLTWRFESY